MWLNNLVEQKDYSQSVVGSCFSNIRAITYLARKQKFLVEDPGQDVTMPLTKLSEKPVMSLEQSLSLIGAITDLHDLCLMLIGIFSEPRASEAMGLQWRSWTGEALMPHGTAYEGKLLKGRLKSKASRAPIPVPEPVRPVIEAWRRLSRDTSPEALMFPTFGRGERKGEAVPREAKNFPKWRPTDFPEVGNPGSLGDVQGDATLPRDPPAGTWNAAGHPGCPAAHQHHDYRQCVRAGGRGERHAGGQLSCRRCARWLDPDAGGPWTQGPQRQTGALLQRKLRRQFGEVR